MPFLQDVESLRTEVFDCRKDILRLYTMLKKGESFYREAAKLGEELGSENLDDYRNQGLHSKLEPLLTKLHSSHAAIIQIVKSKFAKDWLTTLSNKKNYFEDLLKQHQQTAESENQTSLVSSTSATDNNPNATVFDAGNGAIENADENVEVSSRHSATQGSRKKPSIANSRSSRRRQNEEMELENLRANKETEQQLRERQFELEQEREEIELDRQMKNCVYSNYCSSMNKG